MSSFKYDYENGKKTEIEILDDIKMFFKKDIKMTNDKYNKYDYECDRYKYELKTRFNNYNKYSTTLIPYDKIEPNKKIIFLFKFYDGLYYIKYKKSKFDKFKLDMFVRKNRIDKIDNKKLYYFIPINKLKKIKI